MVTKIIYTVAYKINDFTNYFQPLSVAKINVFHCQTRPQFVGTLRDSTSSVHSQVGTTLFTFGAFKFVLNILTLIDNV